MSAEKAPAKIPVQGNWLDQGMVGTRFSTYKKWTHLDGRTVTSSVDMIDAQGGARPEWHIAISMMGWRPTAEIVESTLKDFDAIDFEEDNHVSGNARHFWLPIDPQFRKLCYCKETEKPVTEGEFVYRPDDHEGKAP